MYKKLLALCLTFVALGASSALAEPSLRVAVSILPQKYFVKKIGGSYVSVTTVVPKGASPATYEPKPAQMKDLVQCSLWFTVGVPFEASQKDKLLAALPKLKEIPTHAPVRLYPMAAHHHDGSQQHERHSHGPECDHDHGRRHHHGMDPHIWLAPTNVMLQARVIAMAMADADPLHRDVYMTNYIKFVGELADLDRYIDQELCPLRGRAFMVFHPSWGYFARAYGLRQLAVELEGKEPKPVELAALVEQARDENIVTIFIQPQFSTAAATALAQSLKGQVEVLDPLAEDWELNLKKCAQVLKKGVR